jgi:hypothetical protein
MNIAAITTAASAASDPTTSGLGFGFAAVALIFVAYFLPALIAGARKHHNAPGIAMLNFFLGWTLVGWVVALVWAVTNPPPRAS